jgi:hypothetical protein
MKKVWAYSISKPLSAAEKIQLLQEANVFSSQWTAHENKLSAQCSIVENCVLLVQVDEEVYAASGCSIDKLQRFIKSAEQTFQVELLNRLLVPVEISGEFKILKSSEIKTLLGNKSLSPESMVLNTAISTEAELKGWKQPIKNTWLSKYILT